MNKSEIASIVRALMLAKIYKIMNIQPETMVRKPFLNDISLVRGSGKIITVDVSLN